MKSRILPVFAAAALAALPAIAHADVIKLDSGDVGNSFTVDYDGYTGSGTIDGLASQIVFTLTGTTDNSYTLSYAVANTSDTPITGSRVSGFGFNTNPTISGASSTGTYTVPALDSNVPNAGKIGRASGREKVCQYV